MSGESFYAVFRGVRGSYPVPGPRTVRTGGNTPCVEVRAGEHLVILDAGTGIIGLGDEMGPPPSKERGHLLVIISHAHHDHSQGLPFFRPQQNPDWTLHLYGPDSGTDFKAALTCTHAPPYFPVTLAQLGGMPEFGMLSTGQRLVLDSPGAPPLLFQNAAASGEGVEDRLVVDAYHNPRHPNGGVLNVRIGYRDRSLVYATDVEGVEEGDPDLAEFARGTDLFIHDAMYTEEEYAGVSPAVRGYGHSTVSMAINTAVLAGAGRLALFHHDPQRSDDEVDALEARAREAFPQAFAAREGQRVDLLE